MNIVQNFYYDKQQNIINIFNEKMYYSFIMKKFLIFVNFILLKQKQKVNVKYYENIYNIHIFIYIFKNL